MNNLQTPLQIGSLRLQGRLLLAPMAGVTDFPFRLLCHEQGCPLSYLEMVSAKGFLLAPPGSRAYQDLLRTSRAESPVALQLFGGTPGLMAQSAARLTASGRYALVDINMGCPAPKIVGGGEGSALTRDPLLAQRIAREVVRVSPVPVTVKMRKGWDEESETYLEIGRRLEDAGVAAITLHGRTRRQFYEGRADWDSIARLKAALSIPVIGNGDVQTTADAQRMMEETGCDAVMVGRGAMGNPWLFAGHDASDVCPRTRVETALRHTRMLLALKREDVAVREMRKHIAWYVRGLPGAARLRAQVNGISDLASLERALDDFAIACSHGEPSH
jgi:tRNA-dihydrouridine synthase B